MSFELGVEVRIGLMDGDSGDEVHDERLFKIHDRTTRGPLKLSKMHKYTQNKLAVN